MAAAAAPNVIAFRQRLAEYAVYPEGAANQAHVVRAESPADAAAVFLESWHPDVAAGQDIEITIVAHVTGEAVRLRFDLD